MFARLLGAFDDDAEETDAILRSTETRAYHSTDKNWRLEAGERVLRFLEDNYGKEVKDKYVNQIRSAGSQPSGAAETRGHRDPAGSQPTDKVTLPYGFWKRWSDEKNTVNSKAVHMKYKRALDEYVLASAEGATTRLALLGGKAGSLRRPGSFRNQRASMGVGLGFMLLQFFVDYMQRLRGRADACILMREARRLKEELVEQGWQDLPKLVGPGGKSWFLRWRQRYGITYKMTGMKLKVAWRKVKRRCRVLLGNIFRVRALWDLCHPGLSMRWLSLDQKPSWWNNAGLKGTYAKKGSSQPTVRENFAKTRERYTIFTAVPSWGHEDPLLPPKVAVLFKGKRGGRILNGIEGSGVRPDWMMVQVQENGSYRSQDVMDALDWMLPDANNSTESIVIILDWYSGHRTQEVKELIRRKGHVLLFHGGELLLSHR